ncbi:hypothetical protein ACHAXA_002213 [Cyclostephanos tholiformis]|uniref:J domain-containing protein n=1 Tax=Cyclostephanos tholiformis TaxID=382380 RepID=A0ABD3RX10_9STRA
MSAATIISDAYGEGACLYETVLCVSRDATPSQLRRAYYNRCLKYHPDKLPPDLPEREVEDAKSKFRAVSVAYSILSNDDGRREYDATGELRDYDDDDDDDSSSNRKDGVDSWREYFESIFPRFTASDIDAFEVGYKRSDEEERDVLREYVRFRGDARRILECVMLSSEADVARWVEDYIRPAIGRGEVEDYTTTIDRTMGGGADDRSRKGAARRKGGKRKGGTDDGVGGRRATRGGGRGGTNGAIEGMDDDDDDDDGSDTPVAKVVVGGGGKKKEDDRISSKRIDKSSSSSSKKKTKKASSADDDDDLVALIRGNASARGKREGFDALMAGLEERYGGGRGGRGGGKGGDKKKGRGVAASAIDDVMDDDEFAKVQAKIMKNRGMR